MSKSEIKVDNDRSIAQIVLPFLWCLALLALIFCVNMFFLTPQVSGAPDMHHIF